MKKKKIQRALTLCLTLVFLLALMPGVHAAEIVDSGYCGGEGDGTNLTWTLTSDGVLTISGTGEMEDCFINQPWEDYQDQIIEVNIGNGVTNIGNYAFHWCQMLTNITIPDGVTSIGDGAFGGSDLRSVTIPANVTNIGDSAFSLCSNLTSVVFPDGLENIGYSAFWGCSRLSSVRIPASVTNIGVAAFNACDKLATITVDPNNPNYCDVDGVLFSRDMRTLVQYPEGRGIDYVIPDAVTIIGNYAFRDCRNLANITLPPILTDIGNRAFEGCFELSNVTIPTGVNSIGECAFWQCQSFTSAVLPNSVAQIGFGIFGQCVNLQSATIDSGLTRITDSMFDSCKRLISISIPDSITVIMRAAFEDCDSLSDVYFQGTKAQWQAIQIIEDGNDPLLNATIHYNSSDRDFSTAVRYVPYSEVIPTSREGSSFALTSGTLPEGLSLSADGEISGIPTELGSFSFKVTETYDGGSITHECKLSVLTQYSMDVEAFNEPGYGFVEMVADDGRVQDQTVSAKEELKDQVMHLEGAYSQFQALYLDARLLTRDVDYTAEEGSTKLTVLAETIGDAGGGTHTLAAEFVTPDSTAPTGSRSVYTVQNYTVAGIASKEVHVTVEGELVLWTDAEPYIDTNNRTMTPFRAVGEALGLSVAWDSSTREASFTDGVKTIYFPIGSTTARTSDGSTVTMDTSAVIVNGRTYAPIRYLAEFFGWGVSWDGKTRTVVIE